MKKIAVIGSGIAGMSSAWLLSQKHDVTLYEKDDRIGGHTNTVSVGDKNIDTGFIVYNEKNYPNLIALFDHLEVKTEKTPMSFGVSLDNGRLEYCGSSLSGIFAQRSNLFSPGFIKMLLDIKRFYKEAPRDSKTTDLSSMTLGDYLNNNGYGSRFIDDHIIPMGAAIWSTPANEMLNYPILSFIRFCENHGLLQVNDRPQWRTVTNGSRQYVEKITSNYKNNIRLNAAIRSATPVQDGVILERFDGQIRKYDAVVFATHANQALNIIGGSSTTHNRLLGAFKYEKNLAILHTDESFMPKRKSAWSSWNYLSDSSSAEDLNQLCVTYWMNNLQNLKGDKNYFVTLNPNRELEEGTIIRSFPYEHPVFDTEAISAQRMLWNLQGMNNFWFCGSYFGYGFHEDALQSGLAVAEELGGLERPWHFDPAESRIHRTMENQSAGQKKDVA